MVSARRSAPRAPLGSLDRRCSRNGFGGLAPGPGDSLDGLPVLEQRYLDHLVPLGAHPHVGRTLGVPQSVCGDALQAPLNQQRQRVLVTPVLEILAGLSQMKGMGIAFLLVRSLLLHHPDQVFFHVRRPEETLPGRTLHPLVHIGSEYGVVGNQAEPGEFGHGASNALGVQAGDAA